MIAATYFDGQSTRPRPVTMMVHRGIVAFSGDGARGSVRLVNVDVSERLDSAPRILRLPDGGFLQTADSALDALLRKNGYREPRVVRWQNNWMQSLAALCLLLTLLISGYQWGLPWGADLLAQHLPTTLEHHIGDAGLAMLDAGYMQPSALAPEEQARLRERFAALKQPHGEHTAFRIEFRRSSVGPNAFALPNGVIVMTDELVTLAQDDQALLAVLAHELGHLQRRHSLRRLLQTLGVGMVLNLTLGDVSSALTAVPTFLLDQSYSRDFEREADQHAIDMMHANGLPLAPMAALFEKLEEARADMPRRRSQGRRAKRDDGFDYLSSHPSDSERIARLRAADRR